MVAVEIRRQADADAAVGHLKPALWGTKAVEENDLTATDLLHTSGIAARTHRGIVVSSAHEAYGVPHIGQWERVAQNHTANQPTDCCCALCTALSILQSCVVAEL